MTDRRLWAEGLSACLLTAAFVHAVPEGYVVRQTYSVTGTLGAPSDVSFRLSSSVRTVLREKGAETDAVQKFRCVPGTTTDRFDCSTSLRRRSQAVRLSSFLRETIPARIGWLPAEELRVRLAETKERLTEWNREIASAVTELGSLGPRISETRKQLDSLRTKRESLDHDRSNRRRQLAILEEAIPERTDEATRRKFEAKREEVLRILQALELEIDRTDREIVRLSLPSERRSEIERNLPALRSQVDLAQAQIASWTSLLVGSKGESLLADPEGLQLAPLEGARSIVPIRSWSHLFWSLPLGLLLLALARRSQLSGWRGRRFESPEEAVAETGLPYLGPL